MNLEKKIWQWALLLFLAFIWGSSFILMKRGLEVFDNLQVAVLRILLASLLLLPIGLKNFWKVNKKNILPLLATAFFGNGIPAFLFTKAQTVLSSSFTGMLNSLVPLFTLLLGVLFFKIKVTKINVTGVFIGLLGAVLLIAVQSNFNFGSPNVFYSFLVVLATLCYAISVNVIKQYLHNMDSQSITGIAFTMLLPFMLIVFFSVFSWSDFQVKGALKATGYIFILSFFGTAMAVLLFNELIKYTSSLFASSVTYLIPVVAILWGVFDNEPVYGLSVVSIGIILLGVYLVNKRN
jgi:drug/metabolite transporter (DMT)-like permease